MMYRLSSQEEQELAEARRRLQASLLSGASPGNNEQQQQQLQQLREQEIMREARAAVLAEQTFNTQHQQVGNISSSGGVGSAMSSLPFPSSSATLAALYHHHHHHQQQQQQQMELEQQQLLEQQWNASNNNNNNNNNQESSTAAAPTRGVGGLLPEQRLAILQRAQLEAQLHAQAQAQAEARVKALLNQEAQVQEQLRQLRQRQVGSPSSSSLNLALIGGGTGTRNSSVGSAAASYVATRSLERLSPSESLLSQQQQQQQLDSPMFARAAGNSLFLGSLQAQFQAANGADTLLPNNSGLPSNLREEATIFGKIACRESGQSTAADMALNLQSRQNGLPTGSNHSKASTKKDDCSTSTAASNEEKQRAAQDPRDKKHDAASTASAEDDVDNEEDEEDKLDDDEYFQARQSEPSPDGSYPVAREAFPIKLYRILHEAEKNDQSEIISFFPHGRAFAVHKSKEFTRDIMPKYFPAGRMNTFLKQLNLYGFRRITEGRDKGGYFHKEFLKGKRHLCKNIRRKKVHVSTKSASPAAVRPPTLLHQQHLPAQSQQMLLQQRYQLPLLQQHALGLSAAGPAGLSLDQLYAGTSGFGGGQQPGSSLRGPWGAASSLSGLQLPSSSSTIFPSAAASLSSGGGHLSNNGVAAAAALLSDQHRFMNRGDLAQAYIQDSSSLGRLHPNNSNNNAGINNNLR